MKNTSIRYARVRDVLLMCFLGIHQVLGTFVNRSIDDQYGDLVTGSQVKYSPDGFWNQGNTCDFCAFHPSNASAYNGTWHDGTRVPAHDIEPLAFTFQFTGTAVYLFNIAVRLTLTDVNFTLDGIWVGRYTEFYNISDQFVYNVSILALDNIPYGDHTLIVDAFGPDQTLVLFDYALYTTNTSASDPDNPSASIIPYSVSATVASFPPSPSTSISVNTNPASHTVNVGAVAGGTIAGVIVVSLVIGLAVYFCRRGRRNHLQQVTPFRTSNTILPEGNPVSAIERVPPNVPPTPPLVEKSLIGSNVGSSNFSSATFSSPKPLSVPSESSLLRQQINNLQAELDALRVPSAGSSRSSRHSRRPSSPEAAPLKNEVLLLREEVAQLKAHPKRNRDLILPANQNLVREVASLRAQMDEMRAQQELPQLQAGESLPQYSPPPPNNTTMPAFP